MDRDPSYSKENRTEVTGGSRYPFYPSRPLWLIVPTMVANADTSLHWCEGVSAVKFPFVS